MEKIYYDFWYLKSEEVDLDGTESSRIGYELAIGVFADSEHYKQLDDLRISGLTKVEMLSFSIHDQAILLHKLQEEGLMNIVEDIKEVGYYRIMADKQIAVSKS
ncbi:hypothetical protein ACFFIX_04825 [Metabacillus herbersteinensis]|uniref:Uncharacterized protein n=1 Tax=Metabacillus herbersteinensis TaxID=283816 RepID=A0ABV6GB49_9BACI